MDPTTAAEFLEKITRHLHISETEDDAGSSKVYVTSISGNATYIFRQALTSLKSASFAFDAESNGYSAVSKTSISEHVQKELQKSLEAYKNVAITTD